MRTRDERYWSKVDKSGGPDMCWHWRGAITRGGYGAFWLGDGQAKHVLAHRYAWQIANGAFPPGQRRHDNCVCHSCDNPACCNPAHLFIGTQLDNVADCKRKGRRARPQRAGQLNGMARLSEEDVIAIRRRRASGDLLREIAVDYNVRIGAVSRIANYQRWKHVVTEDSA